MFKLRVQHYHLPKGHFDSLLLTLGDKGHLHFPNISLLFFSDSYLEGAKECFLFLRKYSRHIFPLALLAGIDFKNQTISDAALAGEDPILI